jgi:glycosyltransferase involved in cell wall biosynthesis
MQIICISASFIPANTANSIQVVKATQALAALGHEVTLLVPGDVRTPWEKLQAHYGLQHTFEIRWISENLSFRRYDFAFKSVNMCRRMNPDLVDTLMLQTAALALWRGLPTVLELHDRVTGRIGPWLFRRFWASDTRQRVLTNTEALKNVLLADFNLDPSTADILTAPNGVDLEPYQDLPSPAEARRALGLPETFTVGYTGHFYAGRGMDLMFNLAKALPEIQFLWVGGESADVKVWIERLAREGVGNITLTGFVDHDILPTYQAASDVLLMPYGRQIAGSGGGDSAQIASPMKMFEYMAAGRAIISSDLPVIHEVLDEKSAVFCPPDDLTAWHQAISDLKADPSTRQTLGGAARRAAQAYTWRSRAERALEGLL